MHAGIFNLHQAIAHLAGKRARQAQCGGVVALVGAHEAEEALRIKLAVERIHPLAARWQPQIACHDGAVEVIHVPQAQQRWHIHTHHFDAVVRRGVGKHLAHQGSVLRRADGVILQKTATHQAAHGMRHQMHLEVG